MVVQVTEKTVYTLTDQLTYQNTVAWQGIYY